MHVEGLTVLAAAAGGEGVRMFLGLIVLAALVCGKKFESK